MLMFENFDATHVFLKEYASEKKELSQLEDKPRLKPFSLARLYLIKHLFAAHINQILAIKHADKWVGHLDDTDAETILNRLANRLQDYPNGVKVEDVFAIMTFDKKKDRVNFTLKT